MSMYFVPRHVYVCATSEATVLLDLRSDRYHGLDGNQTRALAQLVEGWPSKPLVNDAIDERAALEVAAELLQRGLLTLDAACVKTVASEIRHPESRLYEWDNSASWPQVSIVHTLNFSVARLRAVTSLRLRSLEYAVRRVEARKREANARSTDLDLARYLTKIFWALRPFFYTTLHQCLSDSLVLVEFLALHRVFPTWVIGVKVMPFAAHSWVQIDQYVLNGPPDYVRGFTPILTV